jgi:hypothetical protein
MLRRVVFVNLKQFPTKWLFVTFEVFTAVTMKNVVFCEYKNAVRTSQETHYVSDTDLSRLMLCKIWGFHGSDYEECRLLGYKIQVRTSKETHYFSATELSQLMLCKIWGFSRQWLWRILSFGMLRSVALVGTDVSGERIASIMRVTMM